MSWHADTELLEQYASGEIDFARASSLEAHLLGCASCRHAAAAAVAPARMDVIWSRLAVEIDAPAPSTVERVLHRLGVRDDTARLLAATPSLQLSWIVAVSMTLLFAVAAASAGPGSVLLFLVVAPLVPLASIALAFGAEANPTFELTVTTPMSAARLLALRSAAVLATTFAIAGAASLALPGLDWTAAAWVLPALGLTAASVALATFVDAERAGIIVTAAWVMTVGTAAALANDHLAAFRQEGQVVAVAVFAAAIVVITGRRDALEIRRSL